MAHYNLGTTLDAQRKLDEAIAAYREAIRLKPDDCRGPLSTSASPDAQGKLDEAVAEYREAIRLKPDDAIAHYNLGQALNAQGKLDEAIAELPRGDPAQARRLPWPTTTSARP